VLGWPTIYGFPYLVGAFGLGMLSAALIFDPRVAAHFSTRRIPLMIAAALLIAAFCWISIALPKVRLNDETRWITDLLLAGVCAIFIYLTASGTINEQYTFGLSRGATRFLALRPLVFLGAFSYSLYLTHLVTWAVLGITLNLAPVQRLFVFSLDPMPVRIFLLIPILLVCAYGFYLLFEKPFLRGRS
jgi:peptidoglycan/LPS O-acetylase OafA/YrhL